MKEEGRKERMKKRKEGQMDGENFLLCSCVHSIGPFVMNGCKNASH
jgi:hypothetical protein